MQDERFSVTSMADVLDNNWQKLLLPMGSPACLLAESVAVTQDLCSTPALSLRLLHLQIGSFKKLCSKTQSLKFVFHISTLVIPIELQIFFIVLLSSIIVFNNTVQVNTSISY